MTSSYQRGLRRILVDMHIPDWDPEFLKKYDPVAMARQFERANANSVMLYCKSHVGLCYWPARHGKMHAGLGGRDVVGELLGELRARKTAACAYYSIVFDNWAVENHPDWRQQTLTGGDLRGLVRYGVCCQNNPEYRAYEFAQLGDLLSRYKFDALFLDMIFWPLICGCPHCRERFRTESGREIPETVDWTSPAWCEFQSARERWSSEFAATLFAHARSVSRDIAVTHNLAPALSDWVLGQPVAAARHDTFASGDLYGDQVEQLVVSKMLLHLSETQPAEFMTSLCANLTDHVGLKSEDEMRMQAKAASALSQAFLFIDAIDPSGTVNPGAYERIGRVFSATEPYEEFIGGEPIEDVAVYFSTDSQMNFAENGKPVASFVTSSNRIPHFDAVRGACRALQREHLPFGVITKRRLDELAKFRVLVLPRISRMDPEECAAIRGFVRAGGSVYASGYTSLVETAGIRHDDFMLADVFGVSFEGEEPGWWIYAKPAEVAEWIAPQRFVSIRTSRDPRKPADALCGIPRLRSRGEARVLATLTVPYGYPARGSVLDHQWASIHSSPPWRDLDTPLIVANTFGTGEAIFSSPSIETSRADADQRLFVGIIRSLLGGKPSFGAEAHGSVWMSAFDQRERRRLMVSFLNYQKELPPLPAPVRFELTPPSGRRFISLSQAPDGQGLPYELGAGGTLRAQLDSLGELAILIARYE